MSFLDDMSTSLAKSTISATEDRKINFSEPFSIRDKLLTPTRLDPKCQLLFYSRNLSIQIIAYEVFLLTLACAKCYATTSSQLPRIGILGGGSVGVTVIMTLLTKGYQADKIALSTRQPEKTPRCEALKTSSSLSIFHSVSRYFDNARLARESDVLVLCMPPVQLKSVAIQIRHELAAKVHAPPLVISVLCGVTQQALSKTFGFEAVVRIQPDVKKIEQQWHEQKSAKDDRSSSPLQLAAEAIAPERHHVRHLFHAFSLFGQRLWTPDSRVQALANVLFHDQIQHVLASLGQIEETNSTQQEDPPLNILQPDWSIEWDTALKLLQTHLTIPVLP